MGLTEHFDPAGPTHLKSVDWDNADHRRSVAASLVQGVYVLERDRQANREGPNALAPPWGISFHYHLYRPLIDDDGKSIFGAIYEFKPPSSSKFNYTLYRNPRYVIAFRGTLTKPGSVCRDIKKNMHLACNRLHQEPSSEIAIQAAQKMVAAVGDSNIWLAGHSLGSAIAMLIGKEMAKNGKFIESFLFNPPFVSLPIERIKNEKLKRGIRISRSVITAGVTLVMKGRQKKDDPFAAMSAWVPCLFVNRSDIICSEYIGYFKHRKTMEDIGVGGIERLATQNSNRDLLKGAFGKESKAVHLIPSASLTVNVTTAVQDFKEAHGIDQWWRPHLSLTQKLYQYE